MYSVKILIYYYLSIIYGKELNQEFYHLVFSSCGTLCKGAANDCETRYFFSHSE